MLEDSGRHLKYVVPVQNNILYYRAGTRYLAAWQAHVTLLTFGDHGTCVFINIKINSFEIYSRSLMIDK